ncbi:small integral membrane protein 19-like isoform X3 [Carassius carassius]|uniref:small integral membrane protein 19-like isoform X3 n=1 Tax=Carassius carassius TaxID=217509 RepID=UPI002868FA77|nr:small integral membrane protein 19-like isoform X3 [Carassius carassius]
MTSLWIIPCTKPGTRPLMFTCWSFWNKRKIMRIFSLPPSVDRPSEPSFYDSLQKVRLRQQLEMYSLARKCDQQQQQQSDSVQLSME